MRRVLVPLIALVPAVVLTACGGIGAPDRAEVREGLVAVILDDNAEPSQRVAEQTADCMLDRLYDSLDNSTLQSWADRDGEITEVTDNIPVFEASRDCSRQAKDDEEADEPLPDPAQVRAGLASTMDRGASGPTPEEADLVAGCILEQVGDTVSRATLEAWAEGQGLIASSDADPVRQAATQCGESVLGG